MVLKASSLSFVKKHCDYVKCKIRVDNDILEESNRAIHSLCTIDRNSIVRAANSQFWRYFNIFRADFGHLYPQNSVRFI